MRNINSTMQAPCCMVCKNISIARFFFMFFHRSKTPCQHIGRRHLSATSEFHMAMFIIIDNRESGNITVECWSSFGRASSDRVLKVKKKVCNCKESTSLTVHYYHHALLRCWAVISDYCRLSVTLDYYRHVLLRGELLLLAIIID